MCDWRNPLELEDLFEVGHVCDVHVRMASSLVPDGTALCRVGGGGRR